MVANQAEFQIRSGVFDNQALGTIGILASPVLLIESAYRYLSGLPDNTNTIFIGIVGSIYIAGWMCSAIGLRRARVTGSGSGSLAIFVVQMVGLALAGIWSLNEIFHFAVVRDGAAFRFVDAAWPLSHLFMLIVGVAVLRADVWRGWRLAAPFICGLALPLFFVFAAAGIKDIGVLVFTSMTAAGFALLGNAVRSQEVGAR